MSNLQQIRLAVGYGQEQLAKMTGISQPKISQIEQGKHYPRTTKNYKNTPPKAPTERNKKLRL